MIGTPPVTRHIPRPCIHYIFSLRTKASHLWLCLLCDDKRFLCTFTFSLNSGVVVNPRPFWLSFSYEHFTKQESFVHMNIHSFLLDFSESFVNLCLKQRTHRVAWLDHEHV